MTFKYFKRFKLFLLCSGIVVLSVILGMEILGNTNDLKPARQQFLQMIDSVKGPQLLKRPIITRPTVTPK